MSERKRSAIIGDPRAILLFRYVTVLRNQILRKAIKVENRGEISHLTPLKCRGGWAK